MASIASPWNPSNSQGWNPFTTPAPEPPPPVVTYSGSSTGRQSRQHPHSQFLSLSFLLCRVPLAALSFGRANTRSSSSLCRSPQSIGASPCRELPPLSQLQVLLLVSLFVLHLHVYYYDYVCTFLYYIMCVLGIIIILSECLCECVCCCALCAWVKLCASECLSVYECIYKSVYMYM